MSVIQNAIQIIATGEILISRTRHDFVKSSCGNYFIDGGLDYCRSSDLPKDKILWLGLTTESSLVDIAEKLVSFWQTKLIKDLTEEEVFTLGDFLQRVLCQGYSHISIQHYALTQNKYWLSYCENTRDSHAILSSFPAKEKVTISVNSHLIKKAILDPTIPVIRVDIGSEILYTNKVSFKSGVLEHCARKLKCDARVYITTTLDNISIEKSEKYNPLWLQKI